jgi:predicted nucleic acid-binding protein
VTVVLDAGGLTVLAQNRGWLAEFVRRCDVPPQIPAVVLAEALTGDHRRDHATNRLLRFCEIREVDEALAREAARLRTSTGRAGTISASDAIVTALADSKPKPTVITSDPKDIMALAEHARWPMTISTV